MTDRQVWKFLLDFRKFDSDGTIAVEMRLPGRPIHVGADVFGNLCVWAICGPDAPAVQRRFHIAGTGHPLPEAVTHLGTAVMADGLVWHVFSKDQS